MKRIFGTVVAVILGVLLLPLGQATALNTNSFRISSFDIQYKLSRDADQRSVLHTVETITARFPSYDQNHGIERALPTSYNNHSTSLRVTSITNADGQNWNYSTNSQNGVTVLRIGDADKYVHGTQVYRIEYTQRDVTRTYKDTGRDEWYWDTNGTEWKVPIDTLTISATIDDDIATQLQEAPYCYQGYAGSTNRCDILNTERTTYTTEVKGLSSRQNVTLAFGFQSGTFAAYQPTLLERLVAVWLIVFVVTIVVGFIVLVYLAVSYGRRNNRTREIIEIPAEYIPPKNTSVLTSSQVLTNPVSVFSAQLIDFAVRHFIEIIETRPKGLFSLAEYDIKIIADPNRLLAEEQEILSDMFGSLPTVGDRLEMASLKTNYLYAARTMDNDKKLKILIEGSYAIREKSANTSQFFYKWSVGLLIGAIATLSPVLLCMAGVAAVQGVLIRPLTDKGVDLRRYLLGLQKYIKAAEVERLNFLQGPDTAEKVGERVDINNPGQLIKLYERVLPYAIVFGFEKEWSKRLGEFYATTQTSPSWYSGRDSFNAAVFASTLSSFSQTSSYSSGSSSSSGGSSGGGSSGGGGGGGGGGGW